MRWRTFAITWLSYASYYLCRKNVSAVKATLERQGLSIAALGWVDTGFLGLYAVGQFAMGALGDRVGPRRLIGLGMIASAALTAGCGFSSNALALGVLFAINGLAQSSGWPGNMKALTPWFDRAERGGVMGIWSTCYQVGGLAAGAVAGWLLDHLGWRSVFFVPAAWVAAVGGLVLIALPEHAGTRGQVRAPGGGWEIVLHRPSVWALGGAYFCLKLIRYSLLFWLPYYLEKVLGFRGGHAVYQSLAFEAGGMVGAVAVGAISDRLLGGRRAMAGLAGCVALAAAMVLYTQIARWGTLPNFVGLALIGVAMFGPDSLISGAAAQDLGGEHDTAKVAGFINGLGSIGAVLQGMFTARISTRFGWDALFQVFVGLSLLAAAALIPRVVAEARGRALSVAPGLVS